MSDLSKVVTGAVAATGLLFGSGVADAPSLSSNPDAQVRFCREADNVVNLDEREHTGGFRLVATRGIEELNWPTAGGNNVADFNGEPVALSRNAQACLLERGGEPQPRPF